MKQKLGKNLTLDYKINDSKIVYIGTKWYGVVFYNTANGMEYTESEIEKVEKI